MKTIPATFGALIVGVALVAILYTCAQGLDFVFGQPRSEGRFGRKRATRVEDGLADLGKLIVVSAGLVLLLMAL